jgi:plasmid stability protein
MASITVRDLDPELKEQIRVRAAHHGRSMEEEVRVILREAVERTAAEVARLGDSIHGRFRALGGIELELPPREPVREPPSLR